MNKQGSTWYVVADGRTARVLTGQGEHLKTVHGFDVAGHGDIDEDASAGPNQIKAPHADPHQQAKGNFAQVVADDLNRAVSDGKAGSIVLAAPGKVSDTLSKDLTNIPDHDLVPHFAA